MTDIVQSLLEKHLPRVLVGDGVAVPDDDEEMNWRIFFAHTQDMQGFRADIFTGGRNEAQHRANPLFGALRPRWEKTGGNSRSLIADLAAAWDRVETQRELKELTRFGRTPEEKAEGIRPAVDLLMQSGIPGAWVFAETLNEFKGARVARKTNKMIRAYLQNAHLLARHDCSYRSYLEASCLTGPFPRRTCLPRKSGG